MQKGGSPASDAIVRRQNHEEVGSGNQGSEIAGRMLSKVIWEPWPFPSHGFLFSMR